MVAKYVKKIKINEKGKLYWWYIKHSYVNYWKQYTPINITSLT